jgi:hypothetical protein
MAKLTKSERAAAPKAGPDGSFPIPDKKHAILALQMRSHAANPAGIVAKVHAKFPDVGKSMKPKRPNDSRHAW